MRIAILFGCFLLLGMISRPEESKGSFAEVSLEASCLIKQAELLRLQQEETLERLWRFHLTEFAEEEGVVDVPLFVDSLMGVSERWRWILASICVQESHGRHYIRGAAGERGAFQVTPRFWGKVPKAMQEQAVQAEEVFVECLRLSGGSVFGALTHYNGSEDYAREVLARIRGRHI